ncbi:hypothetical protein PENANT_c005G02615 [Penicillium antarcticum]|uniref:Peptidase S54 rhomboid domain-containing protein n=1 Tax=Penicillium antarcticum TaxID=416450 RepID=A0A1V6QEQ7_9EURO|nr:uncharacterized protein N7508_007935 [Penicillium antarcticum]KAJ5297686.1 hypothetical protein N7508_007935 [Penicillium antarcticum]OQD87502.1 hypothetical protein PENANT_c005G02615 [Penicillium antarcticum]
MLTSGLTNAPLTKLLLIYTIASSIALSLFDIKHLVSISISPHFWPYAQFWRAAVWHLVGFANSTEALFASMLVYHLRVVERAWGQRKMATFLLTTLPYTTLLPPLLLSLLIRPLSMNNLNYLPSGPTAMIFALLAQYHASIPHTYRYRIGTTTTAPTVANNANNTTDSATEPETTERPAENSDPKPPKPSLTLLFSDKSTTYIVAAQLALSQFPAMLLPAALGWIVGFAWRAEILPGLSPALNGLRVPAWVVGESERRGVAGGVGGERERYEDLRRRLEGEAAASAEASGLDGGAQGVRVDRRSETAAVVDRLRGDW